MTATALVVGATGLAGLNTAQALVEQGRWRVLGLSRSARYEIPGVEQVHADVLDPAAVEEAVRGAGVTHLFFTTWSRQPTEAQNCEVNAEMLRGALRAVGRTSRLEHVVLVTGLKHYLGPFEAYASAPADTPFSETQDRLPHQNFYYDQEDVLLAEADRQGFGWSVLRPHTLIGYALGNAMNMGVTLAVYAAVCRETGEPFVFPGSPEQLGGVTDVTDARLLGRHAVWAATAPAARDQAFNSVNGDVFRWRRMWGTVARALGVEPAPYPGAPTPLEGRMDHADQVWARLVERHGLRPHRAGELASWWHTDADLGRRVETFASMTKSRDLGFAEHQDSARSFTDLFDRLRAERVIPPPG